MRTSWLSLGRLSKVSHGKMVETDAEPCVDVLAGACQGVYAVRRWRLAYILGDGKVDYKKRDMPKGFDL